MKNKFSLSVGIGAPLLLCIFLVLSLISFSLLSFMTARANLRFVENYREHTVNFYTANNTAELQKARFQQVLEHFVWLQDVPEDYLPLALEELEQFSQENPGDSILNLSFTDAGLSFATPINDHQELQVALTLLVPRNQAGPFWQVDRWQVVQVGEWVPDDALDLLQP